MNMKIMPLLNNNERPLREMKPVQIKDEIVLNKLGNDNSSIDFNRKLEFNDVFRQDSPARFMKINTDLMEEVGIFKNDIVVIDPQEESINGKIVVAKVNTTIIIRRYEKIKSGHILYGDNKKISPLKIEGGYEEFNILGVVAYVIKCL